MSEEKSHKISGEIINFYTFKKIKTWYETYIFEIQDTHVFIWAIDTSNLYIFLILKKLIND